MAEDILLKIEEQSSDINISVKSIGTPVWGDLTGNISSQTDLNSILNAKLNIEGHVLTDNNYTNDEKNKLSNIESGAEVNSVNSVNGKIGNIILNSDNIEEGSDNLYYNEYRVDSNTHVNTGYIHSKSKTNPHDVTKTQVGLGNVDNTSDLNKPISEYQQLALDLKSDKSNTYTKEEVNNAISQIATPDVSGQILTHNNNILSHNDIRELVVSEENRAKNIESLKVDKALGKQLSSEDYTASEKNKLANIESGAQVNPDLSSYALKTNIPTKVSELSNDSSFISSFTETDPVYLSEKPTLALKSELPTSLSNLNSDTTHRLVTDSEKSNWNSKLSVETDPIFTGSEAYKITSTNTSNWDSAYTNSHTHSNKSILDNTTSSFTTSLKLNYDTAYTDSHTHDNKSILDTYTQSNSDITDSISKKHTHSNKSMLDNIVSNGDGTKFLSDNGSYKVASNLIADNSTIKNNDNIISATAINGKDGSVTSFWTGTTEEYNTDVSNGIILENTICNITDDFSTISATNIYDILGVNKIGSLAQLNVWVGTYAQYLAIGEYEGLTLYLVTE